MKLRKIINLSKKVAKENNGKKKKQE